VERLAVCGTAHPAQGARATRVEGQDDVIPDGQIDNRITDLLHDPGTLVAEDRRERQAGASVDRSRSV
jgi:hypothetical protein